MKYLYERELVKYNYGLPIKMYVCNIEEVFYHWHKEIELLYIVDGELEVELENNNYKLKNGDIILINKNKVHKFLKIGQENLVIILQFNIDLLKVYYPEIVNMEFLCNTRLNDEDEKYNKIKDFLVKILKVIDKREEAFIIELNAIVNSLMLHLIRNFEYSIITEDNQRKSDDNLKRLERIMKFIDDNYMNKISLKEIAQQEYISPYYFSHFFKEKIGMNFQNYLKYVRIQKSHEMLINTEEKIVDIALKSGFSSLQTFITSFKNEYNMTPSQYRKERKNLIFKFNQKYKIANKKHKYRDEDIKNVIKFIENSY